MRNWPKCNVRVLDDDAKFCIECGSSLELQPEFMTDTYVDDVSEEIQPELTPEERDRLLELALKNDAVAIEKTFELAEADDPEAMYFAFLIELAKNNLSSAKDWLLKSANGGYIEAMCRLADSAVYGLEDFGFPAHKAFKLYRKIIALDENNFRAADGLAVAYLYGRGTKRDFAKAVEWFEKAAALGYIPALLSVGDMYCYGNGVTQDKNKALNYYLQADDMLSKTDKPNLYRVSAPVPYYIAELKFKIAGMYRRNDGVSVNLELSDEFYRQAFEMYNKFLESKIDLPPIVITALKNNCYFRTGMMYYSGFGVERNYWMAINRFQEAAEHKNSYADTILKAENGDPEKMLELSKLYDSGNELVGIEKDLSKAEHWAKKAREIRGEPEEKTPPPSPPAQSAPTPPPPPVKKKPVNVKEVINNLHKKYDPIRGIYFYGKSDKAMRKINNAVEAYAQSAARENIILIFDDTTFGGARDGFLITDKMFYSHNIASEQQSVRLEDIQKVMPAKKYKGMRCLKITSKNPPDIIAEMSNSTDTSAEQIINLVKEIVKIFNQQTSDVATGPNGKDAVSYLNSGNDYAQQKQYERAIQDYDEAIQLNPNYVEAYVNRGLAYNYLQQYERALQNFNKAIELNPNVHQAYHNRGNTYMNGLRQYEKAIQDYTKVLSLIPNDANAYYNRGIAYFNQQKLERAIQDYTEAIRLDPDFSTAYYNRALIYLQLNRPDQALYGFDKYIQLVPNDCDGYQLRGVCYKALGDESKAQADFAKAKELGYKD